LAIGSAQLADASALSGVRDQHEQQNVVDRG
jgi:hypothetical protein